MGKLFYAIMVRDRKLGNETLWEGQAESPPEIVAQDRRAEQV
jgi:hypothetical protein